MTSRSSSTRPAAGPATPDVTFSNITFNTPLGIQSFAVEKYIAERSFIQYLDVDFNQTTATSAVLAWPGGGAGDPKSTRNSYVELVWYGENLNVDSMPIGSVNLFNAGTTAHREPEAATIFDQLRAQWHHQSAHREQCVGDGQAIDDVW